MKTTHYIWIFVLVVFSFLALSTPSMAVDPKELDGEYVVKGWDPGKKTIAVPDYRGWVELRQWDDGWRYRGFMDGHSYLGVGIFDEETDTLSLSFTNEDGSENGITVLKYKDGNLTGKWIFLGTERGMTGTEIWTRK